MSGVLVRIVLSAALATLFNAAWAANAAPQALLEQYRCNICHAEREAGAGPAWVDIAMFYRGNKQAGKIVTDKIRSGAHGGGPWHMPPHPEVSKADASTMARYILSTKLGADEKSTDRRQSP
jgi:cytochrome c